MNRKSTLKTVVTLALLLGTPLAAFAIDVGDRAPLFESASTMGDVRLADYLGKQHIVLALYFAVFTPV